MFSVAQLAVVKSLTIYGEVSVHQRETARLKVIKELVDADIIVENVKYNTSEQIKYYIPRKTMINRKG